MEELIIKGTDHSPEVIFSPKQQKYMISGRSRPESPIKFYDPVFKWIDEEGPKHLNSATIHFQIEYFNSPSAKMISYLFDKFDKLYKGGVKMNIVWHYDDMETKKEFEYEFAKEVNFPVKFMKRNNNI